MGLSNETSRVPPPGIGWGFTTLDCPRGREFALQLFSEVGKFFIGVMSQSIPTGYIPPGNPRGLAQKTFPGGRDLTFKSCPGAGNSTRTGILWKMKLQKNSVDQIFTGETKKKQVEFLTFFEVYVFSQWNFSWSMGHIFWFCYHTYLAKNLRSCPWLVYI